MGSNVLYEEAFLFVSVYRKHHPEAFDDDDRQGGTSHKHPFHSAPPKSTTAMQLYITEKYSEETNADVCGIDAVRAV